MSAHFSAPVQSRSGPPLWLAAVGAALALAGALLGDWQLERAAANRDLRERFAAGEAQPPLALDAPPATPDDGMRYRKLEIAGVYVPERQFLLDNRVRGGVVGYEVLTPFQARGDARWLLVNRGWLRADPDRRVLPDVDVDARERVVVGMLDRLPRAGLSLADPASGGPTSEPVTVVSYPTASELEVLLDRPLAPWQMLLDEQEPDGYLRTREPPGLPPERNLAYAGQWFVLAALSAAGVVWVIVAAWRRRMT